MIEKGLVVKPEGKVVKDAQVVSAESLISQAIEQKVPVETLERLFALRKSIKAELAKESFDKAMAAFQGECPMFKKTKGVKTDSGDLAYKYTLIENIIKPIKPLLQKHGFSLRFLTETGERIKSIIVVKHIGGHEEETSVEVPLGNKTKIMSDSQVVAAAMSFSARYCLRNALAIFTEGEDNEEILKKGDAEKDNGRKLKSCMEMLGWDNKALNIFVSESTKGKVEKWNNLDDFTKMEFFIQIEKLAMATKKAPEKAPEKDPDADIPLDFAGKKGAK